MSPKVGTSRQGNAGKGRKKGTPNKTTASVKAALTEAFDRLGGVPSLVAFGQEQPAEFYKLWAKILPKELEVSGKDGAPIGVSVVFGGVKIPL